MDVIVSEVDNLVAAAAQRLAESGDKDSLSRGSVLEGILELENKTSLTTEFEQKIKFDQAAARNENKLKTALELLDIAGEAMHALTHTDYDSDSDSASRRTRPAEHLWSNMCRDVDELDSIQAEEMLLRSHGSFRKSLQAYDDMEVAPNTGGPT
jgi:hypothetical protein